MFDGYWGRPEATVAACRNLWFHTGDIGRVDADGYLYFVDRKADYLRRRGENISTWEVEKVFHEHADVTDVCVHAVASEVSEDDVKVTVVLRDGAALTEEQLCRWAVERCRSTRCRGTSSSAPIFPAIPLAESSSTSCSDEGVTEHTWDREAVGVTFDRR